MEQVKEFVGSLGSKFINTFRVLGDIALLTKTTVRESISKPFYFYLTIEQIYLIGVTSLLLVAITGLASGSVMALQFGYGLEKFGGKLYVPKVVALSIIREMAPVFTGLMVAGRVGSGMAAEIGSMKVTQQIDAIRALGTSPIKRIVIPRLLAMLIALPLLTVFADVIGLFGGMVVSMQLDLDPYFYWNKIFETITFNDFWTGTSKSFFFAFFIVIIACYRGLNTSGGTRGVGDSTTWVVVASSITILISDFFLTKLFIELTIPK